MRNRFPGPCYRCSHLVKAGEGHFERYSGGWRVQHADCALRHQSARSQDANRLADDRLRGILPSEKEHARG